MKYDISLDWINHGHVVACHVTQNHIGRSSSSSYKQTKKDRKGKKKEQQADVILWSYCYFAFSSVYEAYGKNNIF